MKTYTVTVDNDGTKRWYLNNNFHREDGPAVEYTDGTKYWFLDDKLHRTDGPAVEYVNGNKLWYLDGKLHRTDGPAVEYADGTKEWYLNDGQYTEANWRKQTQKVKATCVGKVVEVDGVKYKLVEA
jgi:hypothetical protein